MDATEIYVLCGSRSAKLANHFLNCCLPDRQPVANEYPFPEFADNPLAIYQSADELLIRLEQEPGEGYSIYWDSKDDKSSRQVMLFFTEDGSMIAGFGGACETASESLRAIALLVNGQFGYVTSGSCPPESRDAFIQLCRDSTVINLFEGKIRDVE